MAGGAGKIWLGGEILQYRTATQFSTSPNRWRLSNLSNRGASCTTAAIATHTSTDDFVVLNDAVVFVALEPAEIGQTRNYKAVTDGRTLAQTAPLAFTFNAPNFQLTTPSDYNVTFDSTRNELLHAWTPLTDNCLILTGLRYEIYLDVAGNPGPLLWAGTTSEWREAPAASGSRASR